jgi:hypothetical protein
MLLAAGSFDLCALKDNNDDDVEERLRTLWGGRGIVIVRSLHLDWAVTLA